MRITRILPAILMAFTLLSCQTGLEKGKATKISASGFENHWLQQDVTSVSDGVLLEKQASAITSKFDLRNFEFTAKLKTTTGTEGVIVFAASKTNTDNSGYVIKINNSDYREGDAQKTGSLSKIRNNFVRTANDDKWFKLVLTVNGNHVKVSVDDKIVSEYTEPIKAVRSNELAGRVLSQGNLIIKKTSDAGKLLVGDMTIRPLGDEIKTDTLSVAEPDSLLKVVDLLNEKEFPLIDFHCHLKGGLSMEQACQHARDNGCNYGIAANCGLKFPVTNDATLNAYLDEISKEPVFKAMQCEGREWVTLFTPAAVARFDYIFTDAMTWSDDKGRRLRLWIPEETFVDDEQKFMDMLVGKIEAILGGEPVDIHVNPTYLPATLAADYDRLWTPERMDRVIKALKDNDVALEINARFKIPSIIFIKRAKEAGVKFSLGTNNGSNNDLGRLEYCLKVISEAGLTAGDMFLPRPAKDKKVMKSGLPAKITG